MGPKYFESQQDDEEVIMLVRRHIFALVPVLATATLIYLIGLIAIFVIPATVPMVIAGFAYNIYVLFVSLLFLFNTIFLFNNWVLHYLHVAIMTTEHFVEIEQSGLFSRKISEMGLEKVQDVSASQKGLMNTMLNIGQVEIQTAGEAENFVLEYIPNPNQVAQRFMEAEEEYCNRHGIRTGGLYGNANVNSNITNHTGEAQNVANPSTTIEYPGDQWKNQ